MLKFFSDQPLRQWLTGEKRTGDENTKIWISQERKELFRWNKKISHSFWRAIIWWKIKTWQKIADTSFNNTFCLISWEAKKILILRLCPLTEIVHFYGKIMQKMCTKASPRPLFYFDKQSKTAIACKKFF